MLITGDPYMAPIISNHLWRCRMFQVIKDLCGENKNNKLPYPKLMKSKVTGCIALFSQHNKGVILEEGD